MHSCSLRFCFSFSVLSAVLTLSSCGRDKSLVVSQDTAYLYLSSQSITSTTSQILGYAVAPDGSLTPVPGSPYSQPQSGTLGMAGSTLFSVQGANYVSTYSVATNGSLTPGPATNVANSPSGTGSEGPVLLSFDNASKTLYDLFVNNDEYQSFSIGSGNSLNFLGFTSGSSAESDTQLSFTANDQYAYDSSCYRSRPKIAGYTRSATGLLTNLDLATPPLPGTTGEYCPNGAAAWGNTYVVVAEAPATFLQITGPYQLVVYSIDSANGSLTTTDTALSAVLANAGDTVLDYRFNPSQDTLAVAGTGGITLFSFKNGALLQTSTFPIPEGASQLAWDDAGHLFAIGGQFGQPGYLYVFNVANGAAKPTPASPLVTPAAGYLTVQRVGPRDPS